MNFDTAKKELITNLINGTDCVGIMPTGAGKSICYQIPAILMDGITLVISPLISLMKDQVHALLEAGIPAAYINSSLTPAQQYKVIRNAKQYKYKLIYVAPERLELIFSGICCFHQYFICQYRRGTLRITVGTRFPSQLFKNSAIHSIYAQTSYYRRLLQPLLPEK